MKFRIDRNIFEDFPGFVVGVVSVRGADNSGTHGEVMEMIRGKEKRISGVYDRETLKDAPQVRAWRDAYRVFGVKKGQYTSSVENLHRMVLAGRELRAINPLVDIYNYISLKYMLPVGGEDLRAASGDVVLRRAGEGEPEVLLIGEHDARSPKVGEVIYADDVSAICRRWNWREADRTKLTVETKDCVLVIDALPPATKGEVQIAMDELVELVQKFCGGEVAGYVLDVDNKEVVL